MALVPTNFGAPGFAPGVAADAFLPDQLIAGDLKVVTDTALITGAAALVRGTVLGQVLIGAATVTPNGGNTGNGVVSVPVAGAKTKVGSYTLRFKSATTYDVINPSGVQISEGFAAGAYIDPEIGFTFTAGGTPMIAGDTIAVAFAAGSGSWKTATAAAVDGSQNPASILVDATDASGGDVNGGIYLMGEFNANALTLGAGITAAAAKAALALNNIYIKTPVSAADPT